MSSVARTDPDSRLNLRAVAAVSWVKTRTVRSTQPCAASNATYRVSSSNSSPTCSCAFKSVNVA